MVSVCYAQGDIVKANNLKSHHSYVWHVENATDVITVYSSTATMSFGAFGSEIS